MSDLGTPPPAIQPGAGRRGVASAPAGPLRAFVQVLAPATLGAVTADGRPLSWPCRFLRSGRRVVLQVAGEELPSWECVDTLLGRLLEPEGTFPVRVHLDLPQAVPDALRRRILAAGWPLRRATRAEASSTAARFEQHLPEQLAAQAADAERPADRPPPPDAVRLGFLEYGTEDVLRRAIEGRGGEVSYSAPAVTRSQGYVGTWNGPLTEMAYQLDGVRRYAYIVYHLGSDDWAMEYVIVTTRLYAEAAAAALGEARRRRSRS